MKKLTLSKAKKIFEKEVGTTKNIVADESNSNSFQSYQMTLGKIKVYLYHYDNRNEIKVLITSRNESARCYEIIYNLETLEVDEVATEEKRKQAIDDDMCEFAPHYIDTVIKSCLGTNPELFYRKLNDIEDNNN